MKGQDLIDWLRQIDGVIRYHKELLHNARLLNATSQEALQERTIKYLEELKSIKEKEGK